MISIHLAKISAMCTLLFWCLFTLVFWDPFWPLHMGSWMWWQRVLILSGFIFYVSSSLDKPPSKHRKHRKGPDKPQPAPKEEKDHE